MDWLKVWEEIASWNWTVIAGIATVLALFVAVLGIRDKQRETKREKHSARRILLNFARNTRDALNVPMLPYSIIRDHNETVPVIKDFYYKKMHIVSAENGKEYDIFKRKDSFILFGESGCGKSSVMYRLFISALRTKKVFPSSGIVFFEQSYRPVPINNPKERQELLSLIKAARFRHLYVYIDGADEQVDCSQLEELRIFINELLPYTKKLILRMSTRSYMLDAIRSEFKTLSCYKIERWNKSELVEYVKMLLRQIKQKTKQNNKYIEGVFSNGIDYEAVAYSPLLCKLLLYNLLTDKSYKVGNNIFEIYRAFIYNLQRYSRFEESIHTESDITGFASEVYNQYYHGKLVCTLENDNLFSSILKRTGDGKYTFIHQSFFEFFVALYFERCIKNASVEAARVFTIDYSNSFADFISCSLHNCEVDSVVQTILEIYFYTLEGSARKKYKKLFSIAHHPEIESYVNKLSKEQFITLKYMLANRAGRLDPTNENARRFILFIYQNDNCVKLNSITLSDDEMNYYRAVLKRCCAISASFLAVSDVEIDFVRKMTGVIEETEYCPYYDLANRSHTLLYYGDYIVTTTSELDFRDHPSFNCHKAFKKRLDHLKQINNIPSLFDMNNKELRWHGFRLFDIATIYCFSKNRKDSGADVWRLTGLTRDDVKLLKTFKASFEGEKPERASLIEILRKKTIELL